MKNVLLGVVPVLAVALAVGCNDEVFVQGEGGAGGGGASTSSSSGTGGTSSSSSSSSSGTGGTGGVVPPECQVETSLDPPYAVAFEFINNGPQELHLAQDCYLHYTVASCADGYDQALSLRGDCTVDCAEQPTECIACGACPFGSMGVPSGTSVADEWSGHTFTFAENGVGCTCHNQFEAAPGLYRIAVPVYASAEDVQLGQVLWFVEQDFELPAPGGLVTIWLDQGFDSAS